MAISLKNPWLKYTLAGLTLLTGTACSTTPTNLESSNTTPESQAPNRAQLVDNFVSKNFNELDNSTQFDLYSWIITRTDGIEANSDTLYNFAQSQCTNITNFILRAHGDTLQNPPPKITPKFAYHTSLRAFVHKEIAEIYNLAKIEIPNAPSNIPADTCLKEAQALTNLLQGNPLSFDK